ERARNIASAGMRALWRANVARVAIAVTEPTIGELRGAQAAVEGAIYAMWRPEVHRTRAEERRLPEIESVLLVTDKPAPDAIERGTAIGEATNAARRLANEPANRMTPTLVAAAAEDLAKDAGLRFEALGAIAKLRLAVNVIGVAPCTENLPGGGATKPGDVFTAMSGKTVEVINTDAEGRLVLVDGITYAQREGAKRVVDVATLTGAIAVALGHHFTGLFGKPDSFVDLVRAVGNDAGDRMWPMPLTDEYRDEIKGEVADIRNSAGREGGAIKAAAF